MSVPRHFLRDGFRYVRSALRAMPLSYPQRIECNVCGWQGRHFRNDAWHKQSICPMCSAAVRHRLLFAALQYCDSLTLDDLVARKRVLHFAPERMLSRRLRRVAGEFVTADLTNRRRDMNLDISDMSSVAGNEFDLLIACDVLEHVENDHRALREIFRVLRPGGYAILTVPQQDKLDVTFEDASVTDPEDRHRLFGQHDHLRIYGQDFQHRLATAGFRVRPIDIQDFPRELVTRHVLFPPELSCHPLATNYRRIYFAEKVDQELQRESSLSREVQTTSAGNSTTASMKPACHQQTATIPFHDGTMSANMRLRTS